MDTASLRKRRGPAARADPATWQPPPVPTIREMAGKIQVRPPEAVMPTVPARIPP
jgi:hypothetical protein